ncbi:Methylthioribose-1-phosphate isomerase [Caulifigura coniformis]|uniref:Methylthioribose-1-phosphate isomerase n=1 Tax=Caulifigura coniformis TaxID=2527983 RepID=A0A517S7Q9_9PLAN|nr:S-methyl-5-thioribose-1-phosphate isomerase [Caulifigura coniformis]QDT52178.1 Methylthioribose-1-phosphate isomerase [Caulifigura coniformis]
MAVRAIEWVGNETGLLRLLDQTRLPTEIEFVDCRTVPQVIEAIKMLRVRGAPAIGVSAAYGIVLAAHAATGDAESFRQLMREADEALFASRPTAVNLGWALKEMGQVIRDVASRPQEERLRALLDRAREIESEDQEMCMAMGRHGGPLLDHAKNVLTHCNAGALATAGEGTALAVIFEGARRNPGLHVYADETRPLWQGARLTAWELVQNNVPCTVICDNMAASLMKGRRIDAVVVGADRITANGDVANKIGTYSVAVLARYHGIPFYVAAPSSTFDFELASGDLIPIEQRAAGEVAEPYGVRLAPKEAGVFNPAFDVTPAELVTGIVTEKGVISPVNADAIRAMLR